MGAYPLLLLALYSKRDAPEDISCPISQDLMAVAAPDKPLDRATFSPFLSRDPHSSSPWQPVQYAQQQGMYAGSAQQPMQGMMASPQPAVDLSRVALTIEYRPNAGSREHGQAIQKGTISVRGTGKIAKVVQNIAEDNFVQPRDLVVSSAKIKTGADDSEILDLISEDWRDTSFTVAELSKVSSHGR